MAPVGCGHAFLTFYPATATAVPLCGPGPGPGLLATPLGAVLGQYIFMPPFWSFIRRRAHHDRHRTVRRRFRLPDGGRHQ